MLGTARRFEAWGCGSRWEGSRTEAQRVRDLAARFLGGVGLTEVEGSNWNGVGAGNGTAIVMPDENAGYPRASWDGATGNPAARRTGPRDRQPDGSREAGRHLSHWFSGRGLTSWRCGDLPDRVRRWWFASSREPPDEAASFQSRSVSSRADTPSYGRDEACSLSTMRRTARDGRRWCSPLCGHHNSMCCCSWA